LECTVARVGDGYVDQTVLNGHEHRPGDLDDFAGLGIRAIRYPVLWERSAPTASTGPTGAGPTSGSGGCASSA
jgi:dTDP-4-dehydrorhamnose reductase